MLLLHFRSATLVGPLTRNTRTRMHRTTRHQKEVLLGLLEPLLAEETPETCVIRVLNLERCTKGLILLTRQGGRRRARARQDTPAVFTALAITDDADLSVWASKASMLLFRLFGAAAYYLGPRSRSQRTGYGVW